jgi:phage protein U
MALVGLYGSVMFMTGSYRTQTFYGMRRHYPSRYAEHEVHLQKPVTEYTGPGLVEIEFSMNLSTRWGLNPHLLLSQLQRYHGQAQAAALFVGGQFFGSGLSLFVITELDEQHKFFSRHGILIGAEVAVKLKEYQSQNLWQTLERLRF